MSFDVVFDGDTHLVVKDGVHKYGYAVLGQDLKTYVKVAEESLQLAILDEISQKVIYSYLFASGRLIVMHRTHIIQNI